VVYWVQKERDSDDTECVIIRRYIMFSLFPSDWEAPKPKDVDKNGQFLPKEVNPIRPKSVKRPAQNVIPTGITCPACEMLRADEEVDVSEIDRMLGEIGMMAESDKRGVEVNTDQVMSMIQNVNDHLKKNIETLKSANPYDGDTVTREDLIKLLEMFINYSKTLENYFRAKTKT